MTSFSILGVVDNLAKSSQLNDISSLLMRAERNCQDVIFSDEKMWKIDRVYGPYTLNKGVTYLFIHSAFSFEKLSTPWALHVISLH